jgi:trehalose/maltose transport system substrate-binding protein
VKRSQGDRRQQEESVKGNGYNPNPVNTLFRDAVHGRLSRREIMKRGSALGLSATLMGTILRAEAVGAQGATPTGETTPGWSIPSADDILAEVELNTSDYKGIKFNWVGGADGPGTPYEEALIARFNEITGAEATLVKGAESTTDRLQFYLQTFAAQSGDIDVAQIDVIWPGILYSHAVDLSDSVPPGDFFERIVENNTVQDVLVGIPVFTDAGILYFRTDLQEKYGFDKGAPATWDDLENQAKTIAEGEIGTSPAFTGFVWQGNAYEGLTCDALEWQYSQDGGQIIDPDGTVTVNNEHAVAAFERAAKWVGGISPSAVTGYMEEDARGVWQGGNSAFMRNWPYAYANGQEEGSVIKDKFDVGQLPAGDGGQHAATLGGWQVFVSKYSKNQDVAKEFAKYWSSAPIQKSRSIERANLPTIGDLYKDPEVLAAQPYYEAMFDVFNGGAVPRPSTPAADLYNDVSIAYFTAVNQILTGADAASTVESMAKDLEDIMSEL